MKNEAIRTKVYSLLSEFESAVCSEDGMKISYACNGLSGSAVFYDFYTNDILELTIQEKYTGQIIYYLHFELIDEQDALQMIQTFGQVLKDGYVPKDKAVLNQPLSLKILLCCTGGLSTFLFANVMQEELNKMHANVTVQVTRLSRVKSMEEDFDIILMAPQIGYCYKEMHDAYGEKVQKLDPGDFATLNVGRVICSLQSSC